MTKQGATRYVLDEETLRRRILAYSIRPVCRKCGRDIKIGQTFVRKRHKVYHETCFNIMQIDVPDSILDQADRYFIEHGT